MFDPIDVCIFPLFHSSPPTEENDLYLPLVLDMAQQTGLITTLLNQIPNQPILFTVSIDFVLIWDP